MNNNILSDEIENKYWYIQCPTEGEDIDTQSISNVDIPLEISSRIICKNSFFLIYSITILLFLLST
jgi:hypothetical protein